MFTVIRYKHCRNAALLLVCTLGSLLAAQSRGTSEQHPKSAPSTTSVTYDPNGNIATFTDADGGVTSYDYDAVDRLAATHNPDGKTVTFSYDMVGRPIRVVDNHGTISFEYDLHSRITRMTDAQDQTTHMEYDPRGLPRQITYPDGTVRQYQWDNTARLVELRDGSGTTKYSSSDGERVAVRTEPNGVVTRIPYEPIHGVVAEPAVRFWQDVREQAIRSATSSGIGWLLTAMGAQVMEGFASKYLEFEENINMLVNPTASDRQKAGARAGIAWEIGTSLPLTSLGAGKYGRAIKISFAKTLPPISFPVIKNIRGREWLIPGSRNFPITSKSFKAPIDDIEKVIGFLGDGYRIVEPGLKDLERMHFGDGDDNRAGSISGGAGPGPGAVGGISLDRAAKVLGDLRDIRGATFDPATGQVTLLGRNDLALPPFDPAQLAVAVRTIYGGEEPSMSIEPCHPGREDGCMKVLYNGRFKNPDSPDSGWAQFSRDGRLESAEQPSTFGTHAGYVLFESDRYLKTASLGRSNLDAAQVFTSTVPGFISELQRIAAAPATRRATADRCLIETAADRQRPSTCHRLWFVPDDVVARLSPDRRTVMFDPVTVRLEARFSRFESNGRMVDVPGNDPAVNAFVAHFNHSYGAFAREKKELAELVQLAKVFAFVRWMHDTGVPVDLDWVAKYPVPVDTRTPYTTPSILSRSGIHGLYGGVAFPRENRYVKADKSAVQIETAYRSSRPSAETIAWSVPDGSDTLSAVAVNFAPATIVGGYEAVWNDASVLAAPGLTAEFTRRYSSVDPSTGPLGKGWSLVGTSLDFRRVPSANNPASYSVRASITSVSGTRIFVQNADGFFRPADGFSSFPVLGLAKDDPFEPMGAPGVSPMNHIPGRAIVVENDNGASVQFSGFALRDQHGQAQAFDVFGRLVAERNAAGDRLKYTYTDARLDSILDAKSRGVRISYDPAGRIRQLETSGAGAVRFSYDAAGNLSGVADTAGTQLVRYGYGDDGRLTKIVGRDEKTAVENQYDALGRVIASRSVEGLTTRISFDDRTNTVAVTTVDGATVRTRYNQANRPVVVADSLGNEAKYAYDDLDRLVAVSDPRGNTSSLNYDASGRLADVVSPLGARTRLNEPNEFGDPRVIIDAADRMTLVDYDSLGRVVAVRSGLQVTDARDGEGIKYSPVDPMETSYTYDDNGNLESIHDSNGLRTHFSYNTAGKVVRVERAIVDATPPAAAPSPDDPSKRGSSVDTLQFTYNPEGHITVARTPEGDTRYGYSSGKLVSISYPGRGEEKISYDAAGRPARVITPSGEARDYEYDPAGNLAAVTSSLGERLQYTYDTLGRPLSETRLAVPARPLGRASLQRGRTLLIVFVCLLVFAGALAIFVLRTSRAPSPRRYRDW